MHRLFETVLDVSFSGSVVILAVIFLRILLKNAPRSFFCALWILAGLRLVLPFQFESSFSLQPDREVVAQSIVQQIEYPEPAQQSILPENVQGTVIAPTPQTTQSTNAQVKEAAKPQWNKMQFFSLIWMTGIFALVCISIILYIKLKLKVLQAWLTENGCWESEQIETAFVLGYLPPKIYLPSGLGEAEKQFIIAHERGHIARCDHWTKLFGYIVLIIHWFNPMVWIGYGLMCRDMEYACDARVVHNMDIQQRKDYSKALLLCGTTHRSIAAYPVSFAESDPKGRIRAVLSYKKPGFWVCLTAIAAALFIVICLMTSPESGFSAPEIPSLDAASGVKTCRISEPFNPSVITVDTETYDGACASYCFEQTISAEEREKCVYYTEGILSHFSLAEKPDIVLVSDYDGAWVSGNTFYLGGPFDCSEYGAKLITLLCGGYANYGAAYGYADYIAVSEGWKAASFDAVNLTSSDARDLNWLCFGEDFVSASDIRINRNTSSAFAREYIEAHGEAAYQSLLIQSGDPETVTVFNEALSGWYAENGLEYTPSEILYTIGGSYHDYLVKCRYATFYLPSEWDNRRKSELTKDSEFLHKNYEEVKTCFETNAYQMGYLQQSMGFDSYNYNLTVELMSESVSYTQAAQQHICINSIEDLPMMYVYYITLSPRHMRDVDYARIDSTFYVGMAKYVAMNNPNLYESHAQFYIAEYGEQAMIKEDPGWNENLLRVLEGETDPYQIMKKRWDFIAYFYDDYYDKPGNGIACSLPMYLIEKYGYETMFNYVYITGKDPIELDLVAERAAWIAHLEETYKEYPKFSDYREEEGIRNQHPLACTDEHCTETSHDHSGIRCQDSNCVNPTHDHSDSICTDSGCTDPAHGHHHHEH